MKKLKTVLAAAVMLFSASAFAANGDNVTAPVKAAFKKDFSTATYVTWEKVSDFYFAKFTLNNITIDAAYNEDGDLVGTSRRLEVSQLPLKVSVALSQKYEGYALSGDVLELTFEGQTNFYVTAENEKQMLVLKCASGGDITIENKTRK